MDKQTMAEVTWDESEAPLVVAVMVTKPDRAELAERALWDFQRQTYPLTRRELITVSETAVIPDVIHAGAGTGVFGQTIVADGTLGDLRNAALEWCADHRPFALVMQWDDDDSYGEQRMDLQVRHLISSGAGAVLLQNEMLHTVTTGTRRAITARKWARGGFPGTILHRQVAGRYPREKKGEDTVFLNHFPHVVAIDNDPEIYLRTYHGGNTWDEGHFDAFETLE